MKEFTLLIAGTGLLLGGCATGSGGSIASAGDEIDYVRMQAVERAARSVGTEIIWFRLPTLRDRAS